MPGSDELIKTINTHKCFGGTQSIHSHVSGETGCVMRFAVFLPPQSINSRVPVLYWLSGLTCTEENFITKAGAQRVAAELGIAIIVPDTSPRGAGITGEDECMDLGTGAGFYLDASQPPWSGAYRMYSYVTRELPDLIAANFPIDKDRAGIFGHSMGGHGALTIALKNPHAYKSVSAFAPICSLTQSPWGEKALRSYLGPDTGQWNEYDAAALIKERGWHGPAILIDQGTKDSFLTTQLKPGLLSEACKQAGVAVNLRYQDGYDHSYYFIASFIEEHLRYHRANLVK